MVNCAHNHAKATLSKPINRVKKGSVVTDTTKSVVLDRELEEEKPAESEPPLPALRLVATEGRQVVLHMWQ